MKRRKNDHEIADEIVALLDSEGDREHQPGLKARNLLQQASDAGSGDLRMVYLQEAQREIAKLDPARHGWVISQLQSAALALQGRRGDTQIAHVTPGEIVIPLAVLTPDLRRSLAAAVRDAGIDPRSLVIGDAHNSTNPQTGRPEFAFGNLDRENSNQRELPPGQQVADLHVNYFPPSGPFHPTGHIGIGVNTDQTQGFYPAGGIRQAVTSAFTPVPGDVRNDDLTQPHETLVIPTSERVDQTVQNYIDARRANPGDYDLWQRQCTDFGAGGVRAAGEVVPTDWTSGLLDKVIPGSAFEQLKRWNNRWAPRTIPLAMDRRSGFCDRAA